MATAQMTWDKNQRRWFKWYRPGGRGSKAKGKMYQRSPAQLGTPATMSASMRAANDWWRAEQLAIDTEYHRKLLEHETKQADLQELKADFEAGTNLLIAAGRVSERRRLQTQHAKQTGSVAVWIDRFVKGQQAKATRGDITKLRFTSLKYHAEHFRNAIGGDRAIDTIDSATMEDYLNGLKADTKKSAWTLHDHLLTAVRFVRYCWRMEAIDNLPRILEDPDFAIRIPVAEPQTIPLDRLKRILADTTNERMKLFILLMLNTGCRQSDISTLKSEYVDWTNGRIKRKRSKRRHDKNALLVDYPLWKETFRLLKKHGKQTGEYVLLNKAGKPLRTELDAGGAIDYIRKLWHEQKKPTDKPLLKLFRGSAAQLLNEHPQYKYYARYFLAHTQRDVAEQSYIKPSQKEFDKAVRYIGSQLGM